MVMELIEGETLARRIDQGPIPLEQALKRATQIADALDRAHRAGVTHRDVKPQNIMITRDGVKVLDFGLAKSVASKPGSMEETLTTVLTTEGTVMGTPQYMAPEQFAGKEADARSDIWAFGAVLYEMVTGRKAFQGSSYQSLVGAMLATEPAPMAVQPLPPAWLERLVRRCLAKDPENRWQTMRDVVIELGAPPEEVVAVAPAKAGWWPWVAGVLALALLGAGVLLYNATRPAAPRPLVRLDLNIDPDTPLAGVDIGIDLRGNLLALSPDGTRLALSLRGADGKVRLHTRLLQQSQAVPLTGTENAYGPFFSPSGEWIGFFADGKLKKIAVAGGAAVTLCDAPVGYGGSWGDDGNIIAALNRSGGLVRIPAAGGTPVPVTKLNADGSAHRWPQVLPGSEAVVFTAFEQFSTERSNANIDVISLRTGERKTLHRGGFFGRYLAEGNGSRGSGHLVYLHQSMVFAVPFHPETLALTGAPVPILEDVGSSTSAGGDFAFAQNGMFVYFAGKAAQALGRPISWVGSDGPAAQPLHAPLGHYFGPRFSPDGKRLAFQIVTKEGSDLWVKDLDRDTPSQLSFMPGHNFQPVWAPDGKVIVFRSSNPTARGLYAVRADGADEAKRLTEGDVGAPSSFSPDGKHLAIAHTGNGGSSDIFTVPVEAVAGPGGPGLRLGKPELFVGTPFAEKWPAFSPDGRWLAYESNESGTDEVYVRPFLPPGGGRWLVSVGGGRAPLWSRDGRELLFRAFDGRVMAAGSVAKGDSFAAGKPRVWTETRIRPSGVYASYDLAPDGKRLAAILADDSEKLPTHLTFLLHFFDELRRKAPAAR